MDESYLSIDEEFDFISKDIDRGFIESSFKSTYRIYKRIKNNKRNDIFYASINNIAALFIDIGSFNSKFKKRSSIFGVGLLHKFKDDILKISYEHAYYYNLSNGKSNLLNTKNSFELDFSSIEKLVEIKNLLWKSIVLSLEEEKLPYEYLVNLGICLDKQFRVTEAISCYDKAIKLNSQHPNAWIGRSDSLILLNQISNTFTIELMHQVSLGYKNAINSGQLYQTLIESLNLKLKYNDAKLNDILKSKKIDPDDSDHIKTKNEFESLSNSRRFYLKNNLTLSEHSLYCPCLASARDDLTIPSKTGLKGDFIVPMEMVLNRLKSEFSFSRKLYYEYIEKESNYSEMHESCFSELLNNEILGIDVEKLRTSFRVCFGILDRIGAAICDLYDIHPPNGLVYFPSFWQLDNGNRREKFNKIKSPGLLSLYSIATDLNDKKNGELSFYKSWRNDLEHKFLVVYRSSCLDDIYNSYSLIKNIRFISEEEFISHLEQLLSITRSAIFSFVFTVREKSSLEKNSSKNDLTIPRIITKKDYL
ncbi:LA2681 family HEPN domain-containing protein [Aliamphritea spongicola]|uniref:LA2681 family HEPN domain-containing protein n=1 Tax=Aliamphritea spongicola TaxID=707589 RepID=UPI001FAF25EC|nr:LA2681 family HEPN domain-containing protein [Aliamphritea spongicola]